MDVSYYKAALLLLASVAFHKGITPPCPPAKTEAVAYSGQPFEYVVRLFAFCSNLMFQCSVLGQLVTTMGPLFPRLTAVGVVDHICPAGHTVGELKSVVFAALTFRFLAGITLIVLGGGLRVWCFHTLGRYFTYEVAITDEHALITSGPYSYVRHPSYTAMTLMLLGAMAMGTGRGSYITDCAIIASRGKWAVYLWQTCSLYTVYAMYRRGAVEDVKLHEQFGGAWERYKDRVQYMFLPFVH